MLRYIELKSGDHDSGPAWIGYVGVSKTGRTVYFNGHAFRRGSGGYGGGNHVDIETGDAYWISGVKKRGWNRHWAGAGPITIEQAAVAEYLALTDRVDLPRWFVVSTTIAATDPAKFDALQHQRL